MMRKMLRTMLGLLHLVERIRRMVSLMIRLLVFEKSLLTLIVTRRTNLANMLDSRIDRHDGRYLLLRRMSIRLIRRRFDRRG